MSLGKESCLLMTINNYDVFRTFVDPLDPMFQVKTRGTSLFLSNK